MESSFPLLWVGNLPCSWCFFTFYQLPYLIEHNILLTFHSTSQCVSFKFPTSCVNDSLLNHHNYCPHRSSFCLPIYSSSWIQNCLLKEEINTKPLSCFKTLDCPLLPLEKQTLKSLSTIIKSLVFGLLPIGSWFLLCFQWSVFKPCCSWYPWNFMLTRI